MAKLEIKFMFSKTPLSMNKDLVINRTNEIKQKFSRIPLLHYNQYKKIKKEDIKNYQIYEGEKIKSSTIGIHINGAFVALSKVDIPPFQILSKIKERRNIKQVWEYLMLDFWNNLLINYSKIHNICLSAPLPLLLWSNRLIMSRELGIIGNKIHTDKSCHKNGSYKLFPFYLGALAHIKEAEELLHGDYLLRHVLFRPEGMASPFFSKEGELLLLPGLPGLSVVDVENSIRQPQQKAAEENNKMLMSARNFIISSFRTSQSEFERYYRDGYDKISKQDIAQKIIDAQYKKWGFSVDTLY